MTHKQFIANPYLTKDMRKQILKLMILRRVKNGKAYSYAITKEFDNEQVSTFLKKSTGTSVKNDVYNTIAALEKSGYIKQTAKAEAGRMKKYYGITPKGREALRVHKLIFMKAMKEFMRILR